jgi:hypothetical protein
MSFSNDPFINKEKSLVQGLTVDGMKEINGCCLNHLAVVQPRTVGHRMVCDKCQNRLTVKESRVPLFEKSGPLGAPKLVSDAAVHLVQFLKPFWTMYTVDKYLSKEKLSKTYVVETRDHITVVQNASEWFEKDSIQITIPEPGICKLIGKVKASCKNKVAEVAKNALGIVKNDIEVY